MVVYLLQLVNAPVVADEATTGLSGILSTVSTILTALTGYMTQLTTWILGDTLAVIFFAIMFIMLAIHVINSLVHRFS